MDEQHHKEGLSVKEIEAFTRKHRFEVFFCLAFIFACFFSFAFHYYMWNIVLASVGGIIGVLIPGKIEHFSKKTFHFIFKQESTTQLILGIVGLVFSIFLPPLIFFFLGLHGGKSMYHQVMEIGSQHPHP